MSSNFKNENEAVIEATVDRLVQEVCKVESGSNNYQLGHDFAMSNIYNHQYLDCNPNQVNKSKWASILSLFKLH